jgi:hypothetical protein
MQFNCKVKQQRLTGPYTMDRAVQDAFSNPLARTGHGTPNLLESTAYPLTRLTRNYILCLSLYRSHWIARRVIDCIAEDMMKNWVIINSQVKPKQIDEFDRVVRHTGTRGKLLEGIRWGRLFGGAGAVMMIKGHEGILDQPLDLEDVELDSYRGLLVFDRWSGITPSEEVNTDLNNPRDFGLPANYIITTEHGGAYKVHSSRVLRFVGRPLPMWEWQAEMRWGISEYELIFDELRKRDNTSWNIASLVFRANIMALKFKNMDQMLATGGVLAQQAYNVLSAQSELMTSQGLLALPDTGGMENHAYSFGGLADVYEKIMLDVCGAAGIPMTKLYGDTKTGLGQSNEGDEHNYDEMVSQKQVNDLQPNLDRLFPVIAMSTFGNVPRDFDYRFAPSRVLTEKERAELGKANTDAVVSVFNSGIIGQQTSLKELRQQSDATGLWTNITDEQIEAASDDTTLQLGEAESESPDSLNDDELGDIGGSKTKSKAAAKQVETESKKATPKEEAKADNPQAKSKKPTKDEWSEADHPRESAGSPGGGEFTSGPGGGASSAASSPNSGAALTTSKSTNKPSLIAAPSNREQWPQHIKALKLPPAWNEVRINPDPSGDLMAIGKDAKGRAQYVYSERFAKSQSAVKFARIKELDAKFDKVRKQNEERLQSSTDAKVRENAQVSQLVMSMGIRPGSDTDTKAKQKAYGATTLEGRHVVTEGDETYLRFTGKKGVALNLKVADKNLAAILRERSQKAGADGKLFPGVSDKSLLEYTHTLNGGKFKTKDFRTLLGTREAMQKMESIPAPTNETGYKKAVMEVAKHVSGKLGNTPTVALQSYISPVVFASWRNGIEGQHATA